MLPIKGGFVGRKRWLERVGDRTEVPIPTVDLDDGSGAGKRPNELVGVAAPARLKPREVEALDRARRGVAKSRRRCALDQAGCARRGCVEPPQAVGLLV